MVWFNKLTRWKRRYAQRGISWATMNEKFPAGIWYKGTVTFVANFEQISDTAMVLSLLTLNM